MTVCSKKSVNFVLLTPTQNQNLKLFIIKASARSRHLSQVKRLQVIHDWFQFYFWLDEKVARVFLNQSLSAVMLNQNDCQLRLNYFWRSEK